MAITYSAQAGTQITTHAFNETLGAQTQQTGNNTVVASDTLGNAGNGQIGNGTNGIGDTYVGRLIIINLGVETGSPSALEQTRICTADAAGTGTTRILTVNEDWVTGTNPSTADTIHVAYEPGDIEDGGAGGGINLNSKSGLYELSNTLTINNTGGLQIMNGNALELDDDGNNVSFLIQSGGYFYAGLESNGADISGGVMPSYNNTATEPSTQMASGSHARIYDTLLWAQLVTQQYECATGSDGRFYRTKWLNLTDELHLYDATINDCSVGGKGGTTEIVRVNSGTTTAESFVLANIDTLDSEANTTAETITLNDVLFAGVTDYINVRQNKTWDMIDPIWDVTLYTDFVWVGTTTGNEVNDRRSVKAIVQTPGGDLLENALVIIYEGLVTDNLDLTLVTDVDGYVEGSYVYLKHATNSTTTTYGLHALRVFLYPYAPFIATQTSDVKIEGSLILVTDSAISETVAATAITAGAGITPVRHAAGETDTRPMKVLKYDAGTGGLPIVGETMTQGTATGVVVEYIGNAVSGTLVLDTWNGTEFTDNSTITGGTGTFSATTDTAGFYQEYTWEIDCNDKSLQITYDYLAAKMADGAGSPVGVDAIYEQLHEWGADQQAQALYSGGAGYYTEAAVQHHAGSPPISEGVWLSNAGTGTIAYFTSDNNVQFSNVVAPILVQGVTEGAAVKIVANETVGTVISGDIILEVLADSNGEAATSINYEAAFDPSGLDVITRVRSSGLPTAAIQDDNGVFTDETTAANAANTQNMNLLPTTPVVNQDRYIFGHAEMFNKLKLAINTAGTGGFTITWQYWNGAWTNLAGVVDDTSSFSVLGTNYVSFTMPGDWTTTTINGQGPYYFIRAAYTAGTVTVSPIGTRCSLDVNKYLPFVQNGTVTSTGLTVTASWIRDTIATF